MKVIIAEKPSLGRTIATAISKSQNTNALNNKGYITVGNYIVTYAYGHLLTLQDMDILVKKSNGMRIYHSILILLNSS
jgi:DNA topoisomerase IA